MRKERNARRGEKRLEGCERRGIPKIFKDLRHKRCAEHKNSAENFQAKMERDFEKIGTFRKWKENWEDRRENRERLRE